MIRIKSTFAMISVIAVSTLASKIQANEYQHVDEMALRIQLKSTELYKEMQHYRHTPQYRHVRRDTLELKRLAREIHRVAHVEGDILKLEAGVNKLDYRFHHIADLVGQIDFEAAQGYGHVHGETSHVRDLMSDLEDCLHHLQRDVRDIRQRALYNIHRDRREAYVAPGFTRCSETGRLIISEGRSGGYGFAPGYNSYNYQSRGFHGIDRNGITLGNGNFKVRLNF